MLKANFVSDTSWYIRNHAFNLQTFNYCNVDFVFCQWGSEQSVCGAEWEWGTPLWQVDAVLWLLLLLPSARGIHQQCGQVLRRTLLVYPQTITSILTSTSQNFDKYIHEFLCTKNDQTWNEIMPKMAEFAATWASKTRQERRRKADLKQRQPFHCRFIVFILLWQTYLSSVD